MGSCHSRLVALYLSNPGFCRIRVQFPHLLPISPFSYGKDGKQHQDHAHTAQKKHHCGISSFIVMIGSLSPLYPLILNQAAASSCCIVNVSVSALYSESNLLCS